MHFYIDVQDRGNLERLEITGVGDPSGRGLGFSYVHTAPKALCVLCKAHKLTFFGLQDCLVEHTTYSSIS